jgi:uncharacterized protein
MRTLMSTLISWLSIAALCAVLALAALYVFQGKLLYPAPTRDAAPAVPAGLERMALGDGFGVLLPPAKTADGPAPAMIFAHGNGEAATHWLDAFEVLRDAGLAILVVEYPGYAGAVGKPSQRSIGQTMVAAFEHLAMRDDIAATRVIAYGRSLGGGAVSELARQRPLAAIAYESSFTTLAAVVREKGFPAFLLRDRFDNTAVIARGTTPTFVFHGTEDVVIPFHHARGLAAAGAHVRLYSAACGHNDCPRPWQQLLDFLRDVPGFLNAKAV